MTTAGARDVPPRTLVVACGALAREMLAVIRLNGWTHVELACLPADLHNRPERIPEAVRGRIREARGRFERVLCLYGDCGTGGLLDRVLAEEGVQRIEGAHCYEFYAGAGEFAALHDAEPGTFYLTDYLVRHFDTLVVKGLGLDRHPELLGDYFGNYTRVVHLAQVEDPSLSAAAAAAAQRLGLAFESRPTGLGGIARFVAGATLPGGSPWRS
jgi:hypothetical protein